MNKPVVIISGVVGVVFVAAIGLILLASADDKQATAVSISDTAEGTTPAEPEQPAESVIAGIALDYDELPVPTLPFADNPDPDECGIPQRWGSDNAAWLTGVYDGDMHQPIVYLYDGHGRSKVMAAALHGTQVEVLMFQANPVLNYYYVRIPNAPEGQQLGWVPAPFLSLEPLEA